MWQCNWNNVVLEFEGPLNEIQLISRIIGQSNENYLIY